MVGDGGREEERGCFHVFPGMEETCCALHSYSKSPKEHRSGRVGIEKFILALIRLKAES